MDLYSALDAGLERRLENWGRWARADRQSGRYPLYRLYREANPGIASGCVDQVDEHDAEMVDRAIAQACLRRYEREMLRLKYVFGVRKRIICERVGVDPRGYERILKDAMQKVGGILGLLSTNSVIYFNQKG